MLCVLLHKSKTAQSETEVFTAALMSTGLILLTLLNITLTLSLLPVLYVMPDRCSRWWRYWRHIRETICITHTLLWWFLTTDESIFTFLILHPESLCPLLSGMCCLFWDSKGRPIGEVSVDLWSTNTVIKLVDVNHSLMNSWLDTRFFGFSSGASWIISSAFLLLPSSMAASSSCSSWSWNVVVNMYKKHTAEFTEAQWSLNSSQASRRKLLLTKAYRQYGITASNDFPSRPCFISSHLWYLQSLNLTDRCLAAVELDCRYQVEFQPSGVGLF